MGLNVEWQIRASQATLLELLQYYWWEQGRSVEILDGPQNGQAWMHWRNVELDAWPNRATVSDHLLIATTDDAGWTIVWPVTPYWDDTLWRHLTGETASPLLWGEYNSVTGLRHWAWFERGERQAEHYDFGDGNVSGFEVAPDRQPYGAMGLADAFRVFDRGFPAPLLLDECKQVVVRGPTAL